jgi:hypothetical protein
MTRRRLLLFALAGPVVLLGVGAWLLCPRSAITRENAARLRPGMYLAEVEAILGGPARDERTGLVDGDYADCEYGRFMGWWLLDTWDRAHGEQEQEWASDSVMIRVYLNDSHKVISTYSVNVRRVFQSPLDMLRRWLRL